ncbi:MAG: CoA pyrophosphatase [SAR86 cluster bacterium]|uniref:CoA pyrophosphatase n=1 Tax=SAR86 cluster bacterium TaxID=2030880 RepID=A0A2A4X1A2_9GAMM|nr:MAG: CoA pyrophosphatase [SAR86 cluster bacterium]
MNNRDENNSQQAFDDLLAYFSRNKNDNPDPIFHPDNSVNKMMIERPTPLRKASVLIPITRHRPGKNSKIVLTVRSENLNSHAGQVSLPGGSEEAIDSDVVATALRESEEEIGLAQGDVEVIGRLGDMALPSGFQITPIVGLIEPDMEFAPCPIEVAEIFYAPLSLLMNPDSYDSISMNYDNRARKILELQFERFRIWGATAAILHHLAQMIEKSKT